MRTVVEQVAIEKLLDENGDALFVSISTAISILRQRIDTDLTDDELEKLVVTVAARRRIAILLDRRSP